jgi:propionyl-CoA carboxylase alpha chain
MFYDPMIAKLITHAPTREQAIDHMADALDRFYIDGIQHNVPFLSAIMQHERWVTGNISTNFIADEYPDGFEPRKAEGEALKVLSCVAAAIDYLSNTRRRDISDQMHGRRVVFAEDRVVVISDERQDLRVEQVAHDTDDLNIHFQGDKAETVAVSSNWWFGQAIWDGTVNGKQVAVQVRPIDNGYELSYSGVTSPVFVYTKREAELAALMPIKEAPDTSKLLLCPMPGLVVKLMVEEGEEVKAGQSLCIVEAMKMENILKAERDTVVTKINAEAGDSLAVDAVIMEFE